jgi:hypothetical protein
MKITTLVVCLVLILPTFCLAQANVNESLETYFLYVDGTKGSDSNSGTQQSPLKTIGAATTLAVAKNHDGIGTRIIINPGTYRESMSLLSETADTTKPLTYQAATNGTVFISGATSYTDWQPYGGNPAIFTSNWSNAWGLCPAAQSGTRWSGPVPFQQDIVLRREMIFVNGRQLTQVLSAGQVLQGTFYVDESGGTVYVWPPAGTNMNTADVEVATLPQLLEVYGKTNLVFRGLTFQYANTCRDSAAVTVEGSATNILFDTDNFLWNNSEGIFIEDPTSYFTVQNTVANHNGESGFQTGQSLLGLWKSNTTSYNNWRGGQGAYYNWNSGGSHFYSSHNDVVSGLTTAYNQSYGIHWDTDVADVQASGVISVQNLLDGIFFEVVEGPVSVANSFVCNNNQAIHDQYLFEGGIELRNSEQISFTGGTLYNNHISAINIQGQKGGISIYNWQTGQTYNLVTEKFTATNNTVASSGTDQVFLDSYLSGSDWSSFQDTLTSNDNAWWNSSNSQAYTIPSPKAGTITNLSGWKSTTGQDASSNWTAPSGGATAGCTVTADAPDYWAVIDTATHTLSANGTSTFNVTFVPIGSFSGKVALSFDGISEVSGLSATLSSASVAVPGSATLTVKAAVKTAPGTYPITILANNGSTTRTVTSSLVVTQTQMRLSKASLSFPAQQINTSGVPQSFTLNNMGSSPLAISSIVASPADYTETNNCGSNLAPNAACTITVNFGPKAVGSRPGSVVINDGDPTSPQTVALSGTGTPAPTLSLSAYFLGFGSQTLNTRTAPLKSILTNTGAGTLNIKSIKVIGSNPGDFSESDTCGNTVAPGDNCAISVTFDPTQTGSRSAQVSISDNTVLGTAGITLSGSGKN